MATAWSEIITDYAMQVINDVRWQEQLAEDPALFFRAKSGVLLFALPMLNRPPELLSYLQRGMVTATWTDAEWTSTDESLTQETTLALEAVGYDLCSVAARTVTSSGEVMLARYDDAVYNAETGEVTFPVQTAAGVDYIIDFYKDGSFDDLTYSQKRLFALAIACVWDESFERNFLNLQAKIHDSTFTTANEATYTSAQSRRLLDNRRAFDDELRKYEQDCAYKTATAGMMSGINLV